MKKLLLALLLLALLSWSARSSAPGKPPEKGTETEKLSVAETLRLYQLACDAIASFDVDVRVTGTSFFRPVTKGKGKDAKTDYVRMSDEEIEANKNLVRSRQRYLKGKFRTDTLTEGKINYQPGHFVYAWNGALLKALWPEPQGATITAYAEEASPSHGIGYPDLYQCMGINHPLVQLARERQPQSVSVAREGRLIVLSVLAEPGRKVSLSQSGFRLYLDPNRGLMPTRIELTYTRYRQAKLIRRYENQLEEIQPGLWVPIHCEISSYQPEVELDGPLALTFVDVDRASSRFNMPVDESIFDPGFPTGTRVNDRLNKTSYVVGEPNRPTHQDVLASEGRLTVEELQKTRPSLVYREDISPGLFQRALLWANAAAATALACYLGYRFWWRRQAM
jgi:hypothetical protein